MKQWTCQDANLLIYSGLDWTTLVLTVKDYHLVAPCIDYLTKMMLNLRYVERPLLTGLMKGVRIGYLKYGMLRQNDNLTIVTVSGPYSQVLANWSPIESRCTRIDFAVDVMLKERNNSGKEYFLRLWQERQNSPYRGAKVEFYGGASDGWTFYNGSGGSGKKLRVYDKGAKENGKAGLWIRYELQVGRDYASDARARWMESQDPTRHVKDVVYSYCLHNGIYFPDNDTKERELVKMSRIVTKNDDTDSMLRYMRTSVRPFVKRFRDIMGDDFCIRELGLESVFKQKQLPTS